MPNLWKLMYLYSNREIYSLKDIVNRVILISELVPLELENLRKGETKLIHIRKLIIMELFQLKRKKAWDLIYIFFSSSTHHHLLLFWHSLLHSHTVYQIGILINLSFNREKKKTNRRKKRKKETSITK